MYLTRKIIFVQFGCVHVHACLLHDYQTQKLNYGTGHFFTWNILSNKTTDSCQKPCQIFCLLTLTLYHNSSAYNKKKKLLPYVKNYVTKRIII